MSAKKSRDVEILLNVLRRAKATPEEQETVLRMLRPAEPTQLSGSKVARLAAAASHRLDNLIHRHINGISDGSRKPRYVTGDAAKKLTPEYLAA